MMNKPEAIKWWQSFCEDTRQKVYESMGCTDASQPVNTAKNSARTILQWAAKSKMSKSWDCYFQAEEWKKRLNECMDMSAERAETITKLKLDKDDLEKRVNELRGLEKKCCECGTYYPLHEDMVCCRCLAKKQVQCVDCGSNINVGEDAYCDDCNTEHVENAKKKSPSLDTSKCFRCGEWVRRKMSCPACTERLAAKNVEAHTKGLRQAVDDLRKEVQRRKEELEVAFKQVSYLEQLLGKAVVDLNKAGAPKSPWREKYEKLHEEYLHQTPTGQKVDLADELFRMKGARNELENQKRVLEDKVTIAENDERTAVEMYDKLAEEIIDLLVPDFYDVNCGAAKGGADTQQITDAIQNLVYLARKKEGDFESQLHELFKEGKSDASIAGYYNMDENEHAEMLVALARVRWGKEK